MTSGGGRTGEAPEAQLRRERELVLLDGDRP